MTKTSVATCQDLSIYLPDSIGVQYYSLRDDTSRIKFINEFVQQNYFSDPNNCLELLKEARRLSEQQEDYRENVIAHNYSVTYYQLSKWDSVIYFSKRALLLTDSVEESNLYARTLSNMSNVLRNLSRDEEAHRYRLRARGHYARAKDTLGLAIIDNDLGLHYFDLGNYARSMDHFQKALKGLRAAGHSTGESIVLNNIGMIVHRQKDYGAARNYYLQSYAKAREINSRQQMGSTLNNIGISFQDQDQLDSALYYHQLSLEIKEEVKDIGSMASTYNNFGIIYQEQGLYDKAIESHRQAIQFARQVGDVQTESDALIKLGQAQKAINRRSEAVENIQTGLGIAEETGSTQLEQEAHQLLYELFKNASAASALLHLEKASTLKDSLLNEEKIRELTIMEKDFEFQQEALARQREIDLLNANAALQEMRLSRSRRNTAVLASAVLLLGFITYLIYYNRNRIQRLNQNLQSQKQMLEKANNEKEVLLKEIHHRVKNNLQVISSLLKLQSRNVSDAQTREVLDEGQNRVRSMALIHQNLYKDGQFSGIQMPAYIRELATELIENYHTTGKRPKLDLQVEDVHLDVDTVVPIGLIINELMTNSLKYAFNSVEHPVISIVMRKDNDVLVLEVKDNGTGLVPEARNKGTLGMRLIDSFSRRLKAEYSIESDHGTVARFVISDFQLTVQNA